MPTAVKAAAKINRVPLTTRSRADLAQALKRASLERQLQEIEPNEVQEILESALEPWLRANGYLLKLPHHAASELERFASLFARLSAFCSRSMTACAVASWPGRETVT